MNTPLSRLLVALTCALCALSAGAVAGAQGKREGKPGAAAEPLQVRILASVFDAEGRPVEGLSLADFEVLEDGVPQQLTHFERREGPLAFGLVVDNSGSFRPTLDEVIKLGGALVSASGPDAEAFIIRFVDSDRVDIIQNLTSNKSRLGAALDGMYVEGGQTAIADAAYLAAEHLNGLKAKQTSPRRYGLVLITDGEDRASYYKPEQVVAKLRESGAPLFAAGVISSSYQHTTPEKARRYLERYASESGGRAFFAAHPRLLAPAVGQILEELGAPYALGYASTNPKRDGRKRKLEVRARHPAGPVTVRAKPEYTAPDKK